MPPDRAGIIAMAWDGVHAPITGTEHPDLGWTFVAAFLVSQTADNPDFIPNKRCCGVIRRWKNVFWIAIDCDACAVSNDNIIVDVEVGVDKVFMGASDQDLASIRKVDLGLSVTLKRETRPCFKGVGAAKVFLKVPATTTFPDRVAPERIVRFSGLLVPKRGERQGRKVSLSGPFRLLRSRRSCFRFSIFSRSPIVDVGLRCRNDPSVCGLGF